MKDIEELESEKDATPRMGYHICIKCMRIYHKACILDEDPKKCYKSGNLYCNPCRKKKDFFVMEEYDPEAVPVQVQPMNEEELMAERKLRASN
jgi:hypothetical protein